MVFRGLSCSGIMPCCQSSLPQNDIKNSRQIATEAKFNQKLNKAIELSQRAAMAPVSRRRRPQAINNGTLEAGAGTLEGAAKLKKCPNDLYVLWNEWEVGVRLNH